MTNTKQELKDIFASNLKYYLNANKKQQTDLCNDLGLNSSTVSDWITAKKYPRMDKVQMIADYLNINKSDLTENKERKDIELIVISKAMKKMDDNTKRKMMNILKASFEEEFDDN